MPSSREIHPSVAPQRFSILTWPQEAHFEMAAKRRGLGVEQTPIARSCSPWLSKWLLPSATRREARIRRLW